MGNKILSHGSVIRPARLTSDGNDENIFTGGPEGQKKKNHNNASGFRVHVLGTTIKLRTTNRPTMDIKNIFVIVHGARMRASV